MTKNILFIIFLGFITFSNAQVIVDTTSVGATVLEIKFSESVSDQKRGVLLPRLTTDERNAIADPKNGLVIYNTDEKALNIYINTTIGWRKLQGTQSNS